VPNLKPSVPIYTSPELACPVAELVSIPIKTLCSSRLKYALFVLKPI